MAIDAGIYTFVPSSRQFRSQQWAFNSAGTLFELKFNRWITDVECPCEPTCA
jgi:hypothetical protein